MGCVIEGFLGPSGEDTYEDSVDSITTKNPFDKNPNFETKTEEKEKKEK